MFIAVLVQRAYWLSVFSVLILAQTLTLIPISLLLFPSNMQYEGNATYQRYLMKIREIRVLEEDDRNETVEQLLKL